MTTPNAWLLLASRFGEMLDLVYSRNQGEIWLFNNDLYVIGHPGLFKDLYDQMLDKPPLRTSVKCIKLLLSETRLKELKDPKSAAYINLCSLSADRLRTFYVGSVENAQPRFETDLRDLLGDNPWVFYTVDGTLQTPAARRGLILVRHEEYPFVVKNNPNEPQLAICWRVQDKCHETAEIKSRISIAFDRWFMTLANFESIDPVVEEDQVKELHFIAPRDRADTSAILMKMGTGRVVDAARRSLATVDFGVVTALEEEAEQIEARLEGRWSERRGDQTYRIGYFRAASGRVYWIAVCRHVRMGSVPAALCTASLLRDFDPKHVILLGIAGGRSASKNKGTEQAAATPPTLGLGDVVYSSAISPYEYEKLKAGKNPAARTREDRTMDCSQHLVEVADMVRRSWNSTPPTVLERPDDGERKHAVAFNGVIASGCKVIADEAVLAMLDAQQPTNRKLIAIEMEGEGVAEAARRANRDFIAIKGISDLANREKSDDPWRAYAARAATRFFFDMLDMFPTDY